MCSSVLVSFDAVALVGWIDVVLVLDVDSIPLRTMFVESST